MLTLAENQIFLHVVSFFSKIGTFPFVINPKTGRWRKLSRWENVRYYFLFLLASLYTAHCILDFVRMSSTGAKVAPHVLSLQIDLTFLPVIVLAFGVCVKRQENLVVKIFNELHENDGESTGGRRGLFEYSLKETFELYIPIAFVQTSLIFYPLLVASEQGMSHLLINIDLLKDFKHDVVVAGVCILLETFLASVWLVFGLYMIMLNLLVSLKFKDTMQQLELALKDDGDGSLDETLSQAYAKYREVRLFTALFNYINSDALYAMKIIFISLAIHHGYVAIRFFEDNVVIGVFSCFIVVNTSVVYGVVFRAAYEMPLTAANVQGTMLRLINLGQVSNNSNLLRKQTEVLRPIAMKVGSFKEVERDAVLEYVDFVVNQIVGLLVSFS